MPLKSEMDRNLPPTDIKEIYTVSQLNNAARLSLENHFKTIWIVGEISNLIQPSSGHLYFTLKDERSQIRCSFFRNYHRNLNCKPVNGLQVVVKAQVSLYEPRGDYQLIVVYLHHAGDGALQIAFEQLKLRLQKEGLFDPKYKKPIPLLPQAIGIVTSPTGAALRDVLKVLKKRFPAIPVVVYPTAVQGLEASVQIVAALDSANRRSECDVLILARGGGSAEDLWSFNEEIVARAIFSSKIPIVTGIGHEIDFTIADFVADSRAPTPSAAAAHVCPDGNEWLQKNKIFYQRIKHILSTEFKRYWDSISQLRTQLDLLSPLKKCVIEKNRLETVQHRMIQAMEHVLTLKKQKLTASSHLLHNLSPLVTLDRGYAIVTRQNTTEIIRSAQSVNRGDRVTARLSRGRIQCVVENTHE